KHTTSINNQVAKITSHTRSQSLQNSKIEKKSYPVYLAGRDEAKESERNQQESENSWLQREKETDLAGRLAGRSCPVLENKVAV
ncbi:hypothetical protein A2U01_0077218, partial [Trifolium medium]|nr:hypothetical protein [Trifolium medium]